MTNTSVGIDDIGLFTPSSQINIKTLANERIKQDPTLEPHLKRAMETTGQISFHYPLPWEDTITLGAQAVKTLLDYQKEDLSFLRHLRFITLGTETSVDMSKSGSSYILGALKKAGFTLSSNLASFQVQQACAGGALATLTLSGFIQASGSVEDKALIITSDISRYKALSTAEVTQGAGASAILVALKPRLVEYNLQSVGFFSADVDDFFRPLGSRIAKVKGRFSTACYHEAFQKAYLDHCERMNCDPSQELKSIDIFCLHAPYYDMPVAAMNQLLQLHLNFTPEECQEFLKARGFFEGLKSTLQVGNLYTGSLFLCLGTTLKHLAQKWGKNLLGKKILFGSYGAGNTMSVWTGTIAPQALEIIKNWDLSSLLAPQQESAFSVYQDWVDQQPLNESYTPSLEAIPAGRFYLSQIRQDGYREYSYR